MIVAAGDQFKNLPLRLLGALFLGGLLLWLAIKWFRKGHGQPR